MAEKYKSSFKQKGFEPKKVSNAGVNKILQEGERQVSVLRQQYDYEKSQRDGVLAAMKENQRNEKADRDQYFQDETTNRADIQERVQSNFKIRGQNLQREGDAQESLYKSLSGLSTKASEKVAELQQDRFDKDYEDQMIKILMGEVDVVKQAEFQDTEAQLFVTSAENDIGANALEVAGASPLQAQRVRANSKGRQYANDKAQAILTMQNFMPYAEKVLASMPEVTDPLEKREVMLGLLKPYMQQTGLYGLSPQFLTAPLMKAREGISTFFKKEDEAYTKNLQIQNAEKSTTAFLNDPENMLANTRQLIYDKTIELGSRSAALDYVITTAGENMDSAEWEIFSNLTLPGKDYPVYKDYGPRWNQANDARAEQRRQDYKDSEADNAIELEQLERRLLPILDGANPAVVKKVLEAYQFSDFNPSRTPSAVLTDRSNAVSQEATNFKGALESKIQMAELGLYTKEDLDAETDPRFAKDESLELLASKNSSWRNAKPVQDRAEALKGFIGKSRDRWNAESNEYDLTQDDLTAVYRAQNEFYQRVQELMADPNNPRTAADAAREAGQMLEDKIEKLNETDPDDIAAPADKVYSGSYEAKIENKGPTATKKWLTQSVELLKNQNKLVALSTKPGLILDKPRLDAIEQSWNTSGFAYPKDLIMLSDAIGLSPSQIINAQREAMQMPPLPERPQDVLLNTVPPEVRQQIIRAQTSNQSIRALSMTGQGYNSAAVPRNLGPAVEEAANKYGIPPAILAGLLQTESNFEGGQGVVSRSGAIGIAQIIPKWHPGHSPGISDVEDIRYAASYLAKLRDDYFGGDLERAIYAYNAGPSGGVGRSRENREYLPKVLKNAARYGYVETWKNPQSMRPGMAPKVMYIAGDIGSGAAYTGQHTDVKRSDGQRFEPTDLDEYVEVEDREYGRVPLSKVGVTGDWKSHTNRNSHGIDFGTYAGDKLYVKNGAKIVFEGDSRDGNGDVVVIKTPDGIEYQFLHGRMAPN